MYPDLDNTEIVRVVRVAGIIEIMTNGIFVKTTRTFGNKKHFRVSVVYKLH